MGSNTNRSQRRLPEEVARIHSFKAVSKRGGQISRTRKRQPTRTDPAESLEHWWHAVWCDVFVVSSLAACIAHWEGASLHLVRCYKETQ